MKTYRIGENVTFKYAKGKTDIFGKLFHDHYEMYLLLHGNITFTNSHAKQTLAPFQLVLIPPGEYHQFAVTENMENYERCVIDLYPGFLEADILSAAFRRKEVLSLAESDRIVRHVQYLAEAASTVPEDDFSYVLKAVATDIVFLIRNMPETQTDPTQNFSTLSLNLIHYLDTHFAEPTDLTKLSQLFFCSVSTLCHTFRKDFGISIKKYIMQKRLHAANMALKEGGRPEEVGLKYGFTNYSTFYRDYKKQFGVSPSETKQKKLTSY